MDDWVLQKIGNADVDKVDGVVIGAGVVGLAVARALASAGSSRPRSSAMIAMTTSSSTRVKPLVFLREFMWSFLPSG